MQYQIYSEQQRPSFIVESNVSSTPGMNDLLIGIFSLLAGGGTLTWLRKTKDYDDELDREGREATFFVYMGAFLWIVLGVGLIVKEITH